MTTKDNWIERWNKNIYDDLSSETVGDCRFIITEFISKEIDLAVKEALETQSIVDIDAVFIVARNEERQRILKIIKGRIVDADRIYTGEKDRHLWNDFKTQMLDKLDEEIKA